MSQRSENLLGPVDMVRHYILKGGGGEEEEPFISIPRPCPVAQGAICSPPNLALTDATLYPLSFFSCSPPFSFLG